VQVELSQLGRMTGSAFGATITIPVIAGATGTINIFRDQIHNPLWKLIQVQIELFQSEMCATITILVHLMQTPGYRYTLARLL